MKHGSVNSQLKTANLGEAYAFNVSRINPDYVSFKVWVFGYSPKTCSISVYKLAALIEQLNEAIINGACEFTVGGQTFWANEDLLKSIRKEFQSYSVVERRGADDADGAPAKPAKTSGAKSKASAPVAGRQTLPTSSHKGESVCVAPSESGLSRSDDLVAKIVDEIGKVFSAEFEPLYNEFSAMAALMADVAERLTALTDGFEKQAVAPRIKTKNGRTSCIVSTKTISKPKTKGKK